MEKKILGICIVVFMLITLVSGCTENNTNDNSNNEVSTAATDLSNCIKALTEEKIPTKLDGINGTVQEMTEPLGWDPESSGDSTQFDVKSGYACTYSNDDFSKMIAVIVVELENSTDYTTMATDISKFDETYEGMLTKTTIKGAEAYIVDYTPNNKMISIITPAGDNTYFSIGFMGDYTAETATTLMNTWLDSIC